MAQATNEQMNDFHTDQRSTYTFLDYLWRRRRGEGTFPRDPPIPHIFNLPMSLILSLKRGVINLDVDYTNTVYRYTEP